MVMSSLFFTSAIGQQSTFSVVPAGQVPGSYSGKRKSVSGVIEVHQLLQALDVAVMEELLLEVRPGASVVGH